MDAKQASSLSLERPERSPRSDACNLSIFEFSAHRKADQIHGVTVASSPTSGTQCKRRTPWPRLGTNSLQGKRVTVNLRSAEDTKVTDLNHGVEPHQVSVEMVDGEGVPPHNMRLCVGAVCMLFRNIAPGWTNGKCVVLRYITQRCITVADAEQDDWQGLHAVHQRELGFAFCSVCQLPCTAVLA
jgi:hypothetical protein